MNTYSCSITKYQSIPDFLIVSAHLNPTKSLMMQLNMEFSVTPQWYAHLPRRMAILLLPNPCFILVDCHGLTLESIQDNLDTITTQASEQSFIALYNVGFSNDRLATMTCRHKIRGIFYPDDSPEIMNKGIGLILAGHLWLPRQLLSACIRAGRNHETERYSHRGKLLSNREIEILKHLTAGSSNQEIADDMQISMNTVKNHLYTIYKKLNVTNRLHASRWANDFFRHYHFS